ncbi:MAG: PolC-type DNA polymerase III [Phascolarctobacterium sp.]|nr:PolC-type DNA polymerase III [Phascolarctobacterium sp.]
MMQTKYCIVPDEEKFFNFLSTQSFSESELLQLRLMHITQICVDETTRQWEVHFTCAAHLKQGIIQAAAMKLAAAFSLQQVDMLCDGDGSKCSLPQGQLPPEVEIRECTGEPLPDELPLPPEPASVEIGQTAPSEPLSCDEVPLPPEPSEQEAPEYDKAYMEAYNALYGEKKDDGLLWGRTIKGQVRKIDSLFEEEDKVVVEGKFVKTMDKDGNFQTFVEHEVRGLGDIILGFNLCDETNGIAIKMRFRNSKEDQGTARRECNAFKDKLKVGAKLRCQGKVANDRFLQDELSMMASGIMKLESDEKPRMDNAEVKRVELHCHTKMSKMDGLTPMEDLVKQAIKWGHKALAITDHGVVQAFPFCFDAAEGSDLKLIFGMEGYLIADRNLKGADVDQEPTDTMKKSRVAKIRSHHIILLAKNETGLRNLYKLVTISHLRHFNKRPLLPREVISEYREGLIIGSACEAGELYQAVRGGASDAELEEIASFYDYLEIQPTGNNMFLVREGYATEDDLREDNRRIYELGQRLGKLVCATCDVHFLNPEDAKLRTILQAAQNYKDADIQPPLYLHTTEEMLEEFAYLGKEAAYEVVVTNTNKIAELVERFKPVPDRDQLYSPSIPGAEDAVRDLSYSMAHKWYGDKLPQIVEDRLKMELDAIIGHGFSVLYYIAHKLVKHSLDRGYLVGSRGSVGSSFVATMLEITEVNALKPHYRCPHCRHSEFFLNNEVDSGFDLPMKDCPECGTPMLRDGHDIPFAVFLGFHGDKVPDIDLNFSGGHDPDDASPHPMSDQEVAHKYTEELFGRDNVCRAGTIATVANKTAVGYIKKYYEERNLHAHPAKIAELVGGLAGIKRTTGQHPGGIMVVPRNMDIHYITPMNRPADKPDEPTITTHYDYHSINDRLVKLDILGHDDPMVLKMLEKYMQEEVDPTFDPKNIPVGDEETMRIFQNTSSLGVTPEQIGSEVGTFGIPECGTNFVRQMIHDVQPKKFSEVVRVSGYSHGTDVWLNNAQDLIKEGKPVAETISTRDDIMTHLISKGVEPSLAFKTMEHVRKGKAAKKGLEPKMLEAMKAAQIPDWYIHSCEKVQYLFPKAHAVAYVLMAYRIAYCKVHYPKEFYAAYFTVRATDFDYNNVSKGQTYVQNFIKNVYNQGFKASVQDKSTVTYLELANEMMARGLKFEKPDLYKSHAIKFKITENGLLPPLGSIGGVGEIAAKAISACSDPENPFISWEDLKQRAGIGQNVIDSLANAGVLAGLPESNQISLF